jgi:hypothetical protein
LLKRLACSASPDGTVGVSGLEKGKKILVHHPHAVQLAFASAGAAKKLCASLRLY